MTDKIYITATLDTVLKDGATLIASISGGKDGQAMVNQLVIEYYHRHWTGPFYCLHMDLGRSEWLETPNQVARIAANAGLELVVRKRPQGDLVQEIEDRMLKLTGIPPWPRPDLRFCTSDQKRDQAQKEQRSPKPFWPSSETRYCTSDQKRDQGAKEIREPKPFWPSPDARYCTAHQKTNQGDKETRRHQNVVISAQGIRAEESRKREKKKPLSINHRVCSQERMALEWYPIFYWSEAEVYRRCGHSIEERDYRRQLYREGQIEEALADWNMHPCYIYGMSRCSCGICILNNPHDRIIGVRYNRWLAKHYSQMEIESGFSFWPDQSITEILTGEPLKRKSDQPIQLYLI
jgi:3'-phosphoadenosine 5'-phosphosulfate sulfotransferase (PAPS reductase)/FAD synthetase